MIKRIISIITISFIVFSIYSEKTFSSDKQTYFVVTAYYSPLPNQTHYIMGSYAKEIRMNGRGIRGASGKKVFPGMLAAPSNYPFGTKIKLEGIGVGEVADRGGAIVKAGVRSFKYDRIDIWVGHGEEGLQRAMHWGTRTIKGQIINKNNSVNLPLSKLPAPRWTIYHAKKNPDFLQKATIKNKVYLNGNKEKVTNNNSPIIPFHKGDENKIFSGPITNSTGVKKLQEILTEMRLYSGEINGEYTSIKKIILDFQLKYKVISKKSDIGAGNFGPKTRKTLKQKYNLFLKNKKIEEEIKKQEKIKLEKAKKQAIKRINSIGNVKYGDISHQVRSFQIILKDLGYFDYKDTAIFGPKTKQSLIKYQFDKKIILSSKIHGAGIFGPQTREMMIKDLSILK